MESAPGEAYSAAWGRKFRLGKIGRGNLSNIRFWAGEEYSISRPKLPPWLRVLPLLQPLHHHRPLQQAAAGGGGGPGGAGHPVRVEECQGDEEVAEPRPPARAHGQVSRLSTGASPVF